MNILPHLGNVVIMGERSIFPASQRAYTYGLLGCAAIVAKRGDQILFFHATPLQREFAIMSLRKFRPERSVVFCPGEWKERSKTEVPRWALSPEPGWPPADSVVPYSMLEMCGESRQSRAVWYDQGKVYGFNEVADLGGCLHEAGTGVRP